MRRVLSVSSRASSSFQWFPSAAALRNADVRYFRRRCDDRPTSTPAADSKESRRKNMPSLLKKNKLTVKKIGGNAVTLLKSDNRLLTSRYLPIKTKKSTSASKRIIKAERNVADLDRRRRRLLTSITSALDYCCKLSSSPDASPPHFSLLLGPGAPVHPSLMLASPIPPQQWTSKKWISNLKHHQHGNMKKKRSLATPRRRAPRRNSQPSPPVQVSHGDSPPPLRALTRELRDRCLFEFDRSFRKVHVVHVRASVEEKVSLLNTPPNTPITDKPSADETLMTSEQNESALKSPLTVGLPAASHLSNEEVNTKGVDVTARAPEANDVVVQRRIEPLCDVYMSALPRVTPRLVLDAPTIGEKQQSPHSKLARSVTTKQKDRSDRDMKRLWNLNVLQCAAPEFGTMCYVMVGAQTKANAELHAEMKAAQDKKEAEPLGKEKTPLPSKKKKKKKKKEDSVNSQRASRVSTWYKCPPAPGEVRLVIFDRDRE